MSATPEVLHSVNPPTPEAAIFAPPDPWGAGVALERVKRDFESSESYIRMNHMHRWIAADELYCGYVKQKVWEGTRIPRSSLSTHVVFEHIESMIPKVITVLFGDPYWFEAAPYPGTDVNEARMVQELMLAQMREVNHSTGIREVFRKAIKSSLKYGNGIVHLGWSRSSEQKPSFRDELIPLTSIINDPIYGPIPVPTGKFSRRVEETVETVEINEPLLEFVDIRDFFPDPHCSSPNPRDGRYCIRRKLPTIGSLKAMASNPAITLPTDAELYGLALQKQTASSDQAKQTEEALRHVGYHPQQEYSVAGEHQRVELLEYWTPDRLVMVLGRSHVLFNAPNPYNRIPFYGLFYADLLGRFFAMAQSDVLEPEQRLQTSIVNAQVDELAIHIHRPAKKKRGQPIPMSQLRRRPGLVTEADDPEKDVMFDDSKPVLQDSYIQLNASDARAQRRDGISEIAVQGTPGQGSSINRTATGVNAQVMASMSRIGYFVENIQEFAIVPLLDDLLLYNKKFNTPPGIMEYLGADGQVIQLEPAVMRRVETKFEMRASNKAQSRAALLSILELTLQTFMNPSYLQLLNQRGLTIDDDEISNMVFDATGYRARKKSLFRQLSPQELSAMRQQAIDQTKIATQTIRGDYQAEITEEKEASSIVRELIKTFAAANKQAATFNKTA